MVPETGNEVEHAIRSAEVAAARREMVERREAQRIFREKHARNAIKPGELAEIEAYLRSPVSTGFWRLTVKKKFDGPFFSYLAGVFGVSPQELHDESRRSSDDRAAELKKLSTVMRAVTAGILFEDRAADLNRAVLEHGMGKDIPYSPEVISRDFAPVLNAFRQFVYHPDFLPTISQGRAYRVKSGVLLLDGSWSDVQPSLVATQKKPLEDMAAFIVAAQLGKPELERIFSPEDELFRPYFKLLYIGYDDIIKDSRIKSGLKTAFDYFTTSDFTHCISSLGLIAEDFLTQVFEYYFRMPCGKGHTLGQIYELINNKLREFTQPMPPGLGDMDAIYRTVNELEQHRGAPDNGYEKKVEAALRDVISLIKADRRYFGFRIDQATKGGRRASLFPSMLNEDLGELIRYRNAASHKSRVPLGSFEALRTLYCLVTFVVWWHETRMATDWQLPRDEILRTASAAAAAS